ncbi:MAG: hypothetical protein V5B33_07500 [Candidatus Accumulibacter sp. UW20]|jgi:hypothetical protein
MPVLIHKRLWGALWVSLAVTPTGFAQVDLKLPSSDDDYRQLLDEQRSGPCDRCGVVTAIRTQTHAGPRPPSRAPAVAPGLTTAPLIGTGSAVADAREANAPVTTYIISVRYEDGSFTFVEQDDPPVIVKGDRVRIFDGRVELRQD